MAGWRSRVGAVLFHALAQGCRTGRTTWLSSLSSPAPGGGGGGGVPRMFSSIHLPRLTGEVRVGFEVSARMLACGQDAAALVAGQSNAAELRLPCTPGMP